MDFLLHVPCMLASCLSASARIESLALASQFPGCMHTWLVLLFHCSCAAICSVTCTLRVCFLCRYAQVIKRDTPGNKEIYDVTMLPEQQLAVVKFAQHPYPQQVHVECASRHLAPELLGVYPMPGGFTQVQSLGLEQQCLQHV